MTCPPKTDPAIITVYEVIRGEKIIIGKPFDGKYTEKGCFEDNPKYLLEKAKKLQELKKGTGVP